MPPPAVDEPMKAPIPVSGCGLSAHPQFLNPFSMHFFMYFFSLFSHLFSLDFGDEP
jgi:hypothetical protein